MDNTRKVRIWNKKRKRMVYLDQMMVIYSNQGKVKLVLGTPFHDDYWKGEIKDFDLMLAIGQRDEHGRDIYENDIVGDPNDPGYCGVVRYGNVTLEHDGIVLQVIGFYVDTQVESMRAFMTEELAMGRVVVAGNVYEHSHLIPEGEEDGQYS